MEDKVFATLEYDKIKELLKGYCSSSLGIEKVDEIYPLEDLDEINHLLDLNADAIELIAKYSTPPLYGIHELSPILKRLERGGILENYQFLQVADSLRVSQALKDYVENMEADNLIKDKIKLLYTNKRIESEIERIIVDDENIADDASRTLFNIRRNIRNKTEDIRRKLNSIVQNKDSQEKLQESFVTMRDGRYVVPVKAANKSSFPGITHDRSATGQTIYIEPMVVVELNNEIKQLQIEENDEVRRILKELSELVGQYREEISINEDLLIELDLIFAKAKMALSMNASRPILNEDKIIDLKEVRHPLLDAKTVVPIDIKLGDGFNALIITGPNTGGKTVTLKSLGLMILMSQSGLFIPCGEYSKVAIFSNIYADIGDKQSIELSLSTFSASMTNIVDILNKADDKSLVLFDELGSGTDPTEGAALAMSIIDYLLKKDVLIVSTTHYSELKLYAMTTEGVQNASVEFDVESLSPTYRLIIGMPGKSNAFEISKRLGLSKDVLDHAASYISKENRDFESLISEIEGDRLQAEKRLQEVQALKQKYESLNKELEESIENKKLASEHYLEKSKEEASKILDEAKEEAKALLKMAKRTARDTSSIDRSYTEISDRYNTLSTKYERPHPAKKKQTNKTLNLMLGESVKISSMDDVGIVQYLPDSKGDLVVQIGILKFSVNIDDIEKANLEIKNEKSKSAYRSVLQAKSEENYSSTLDLRGKNTDEAIGDVEKFLDNATILGMKEVQIIHGKGTGALRQGIGEFLSKSRYMEQFRLGTLKEGGAGVTVVTLK